MQEIEFEHRRGSPVVAMHQADDPVDSPWSKRLRLTLVVGVGLFALAIAFQVVVGDRAVEVARPGAPPSDPAPAAGADEPANSPDSPDLEPITGVDRSSIPQPVTAPRSAVDQAPPPPRPIPTATTAAVHVLEPPPLRPIRSDVTLAASDRGIVAFGGVGEAGQAPLTDGAFYNFATSAWTMMSTSPFSGDAAWTTTSALWVGDELIVYRGERGAAWDRTADSWRDLAPAPRPISGLVLDSLESGDTLLLGLNANAMYDIAADRWTPFSGIAVVGPDPAAGAGEALVESPVGLLTVTAWGEIREVMGGRNLVDAGTWGRSVVGAAWTGNEVLIVTDDADAIVFNPEANDIRRLPPVPLALGDGPIRVDVVPGGRAIVNETAIYDECCGWFVMPYPAPGNSAAGVVRHAGALWRLGVIDGDWTFTRLDDGWSEPRTVVALGTATMELGDTLKLLSLTTSLLPSSDAPNFEEYIVARVTSAASSNEEPSWRCEVIYGSPGQASAALRASAVNNAGPDRSRVSVLCPDDGATQQLLAALAW